jgi:hypothetical protein
VFHMTLRPRVNIPRVNIPTNTTNTNVGPSAMEIDRSGGRYFYF